MSNHCPKCRDVELVQPSERATRILRCVKCKGTWLPKSEARLSAVSTILAADDSMLPGSSVDQQAGLCPQGHGILLRAKVELEKPFYVDRCGECAGIWFDRGEWNKLARAHLLDQMERLWDPAWQYQLRRERQEANYRARIEEDIGRELFLKLTEVAQLMRGHSEQVQSTALAYLREEMNKKVDG